MQLGAWPEPEEWPGCPGRLLPTGASVPCPLPHSPSPTWKGGVHVCQPQDVPLSGKPPQVGYKIPGLGTQLVELVSVTGVQAEEGGRDSAPVMSVPSQSGHCHPHLQLGAEG